MSQQKSVLDDSDPEDAQASTDVLEMILVMGLTGVGKSYFINQLAGSQVAEESSLLYSCTSRCTALPVAIAGRVVLLVDTPGFDDTYRSDAEILSEISQMLIAQHKLGVRLKGVIYLQRISDDRFGGSSQKTLRLFKQICGEKAYPSVLLVTTRWDRVESEEIGNSRERALSRDLWRDILNRGANMARFYGDRGSAQTIVSQLVVNSTIVVLQIQKELIDEGKSLEETRAGAAVSDDITVLKSQLQQQLDELNTKYRKMDIDERQRRELERQIKEENKNLQDMVAEGEKLQEDLKAQVEQKLCEETPKVQEKVKQSKRRKYGKMAGSVALRVLPAIALELLGLFLGIPGLSTTVTG